MTRNPSIPLIAFAVLFAMTSTLFAAPSVTVAHHEPMNLFFVGESVRFDAQAKDFSAGDVQASIVARNYFGEDVKKLAVPVAIKDKATPFVIDLGPLDPGYYDLTVALPGGKGGAGVTQTLSFGVCYKVTRTAEEVRRGGYRFGLKVWQVDDIWWRRPLQWHLAECVDACTALGLQWTRHQFNQSDRGQTGVISTQDLITKHAMNVVLKVEGFPAEFYDEKRYGPKEDWEKKHTKGQWSRFTVPMKEPYEKWLAAQIGNIPPEQNVFEIGNEPWGKITPEEYAEWCQTILKVIKAVRPSAIVGPNTGMAPIEWERAFIAAGGMAGMDMVTTHPYSFSPLPERRTRESIRNYRDFLRARLHRDIDIYVTEYGWSTAPKDSRHDSVPERQQAQRTTRQSLMLYAEDIKTLIPHWMADREQDPTDRENFFGFFRLNEQPKPVVIAHAQCARMIDGSHYVGDLWYGPGIGAMLFERQGTYTLALWTLQEDLGQTTDLQVPAGVEQLTIADMMGRERIAKTDGGKLSLKISSDMTYLVGVSPKMAAAATGPAQDLNPERWLMRGPSVVVKRAAKPPVIDGVLDDWAAVKAIAMKPAPARVAADDYQGDAMLSWDSDHVYVAMRARDAHLTPGVAGKSLGTGDVFHLGLNTRPSRQPALGGWGMYDYYVDFAPTAAADGKPLLRISNSNWEKPRDIAATGDPSGVEWAMKPTADGWAAEIAIPIKLLDGFPAAAPHRQIDGCVEWVNVDKPGAKPIIRLNSAELKTPQQWPYFLLEE